MRARIKKVIAMILAISILSSLVAFPSVVFAQTPVVSEYTSPETIWDFNNDKPASEGYNIPVASGSAIWDEENKNIKFDASVLDAGSIDLKLKPSVKSSVKVSFDMYVGRLGGQMITYSISDAEGRELIYCQVHPYGGTGYTPNGLRIGGINITDGETIGNALTSVTNNGMDGSATNNNIDIDFNAKTATVKIGKTTFTGDIQEDTTGDIKDFNFTVSRTKKAGGRECYFDNLTVSEYTSSEPIKPSEITNGYEEAIYAGVNGTMPYRYSLPVNYEVSKTYPVVVYLHGETRAGADNISQLYNSQYLFNEILASQNECILVAPQCAADSSWVDTPIENGTYDISDIEQSSASKLVMDVIGEIQNGYSVDADKIYLAGQSNGAYGCWDLALRNPNTFAAIIPMAGAGSLDGEKINALADANIGVWVFHGYSDEIVSVSNARDIVNRLQTSGATDIQYTEYPFDSHSIAEKSAKTIGLSDWLFNQSITANTEEKTEERIVDLAIFMGQSNMAGRGDYEDSIGCPVGHGYEFHSVTTPNVLTTVSEPFGKFENNDNIHDAGSNGIDRRNGDMVSAFMAKYYEASGVPVVGVQCSRGGTNTGYWLSSTVLSESAKRYNDAKAYLEENGYTVRNEFMVWCQGEADADKGTSADSYKTQAKSIFNAMKNNTGLDNIFIVKIGHYNINYGLASGQNPNAESLKLDSNYQVINSAQKALADENDDITEVASFYTDEYLLLMRDKYHFYQKAYNEVGTMAGYNTAVKFDSSIGEPIPVPDSSSVVIPTPTPTSSPTPTPTPEPSDGTYYLWDFSTNQTASSGNNVPVVSGTAAWSKENQNIKFDANSNTAGELKVLLSPNAEGIITTEFDTRLTTLGSNYFNFNFLDNNGQEVVSFALEAYNGIASLKIGDQVVAADSSITTHISAYKGDGMSASPTKFKVEINYPKKTATVFISGKSEITFTGSIPDTYTNKLESVILSSNRSKTADRSIYVDNLSIKAETPNNSIYVVGPVSVSKKIDETVETKYEINKTYVDDTEVFEWSVSGVDGVAINKDTGVLQVMNSAKTGTAIVKATLKAGSTLPIGTEAVANVKINDFPAVKSYDIDGTTTLEMGKNTTFSIVSVSDEEGNDISNHATLIDFASSNTSVATIDSNGKLSAVKAGITVVTFKLNITATNTVIPFSKTVRVGTYEITSSDEYIDVSSLETYGTNTYRIYTGRGQYKTVAAENNKVHNTTGKEVVIVADYKFEFTNSTIDGYVDVKTDNSSLYSAGKGFGLKSIGSGLTGNGYRMMKSLDLPFIIDLPDGYYDIRFTKTCSGRIELFANDIKFTQYGSPNVQNRETYPIDFVTEQVKVEDGVVYITTANTTNKAEQEYIESLEFVRVPDKYRKTSVFIAGDSTAANYFPTNQDSDLQSDKIMMTGWGMQINKFLPSDKYTVTNLAEQGRYAEDWYEDTYEDMLHQMQKGDVLLIDFGINDGNKSVGIENSNNYISQMVNRAKDKGVKPIIISPVYNSKYNHKTYYTYNVDTDTNAGKTLADLLGVPFIDLSKYTTLYVNKESLTDTNWKKNNYHVADDLHLTQYSSLLCASFIAASMSEIGYDTTDFAFVYKDISSTIADANGNSGYLRGEENGVVREYSVETAREFMGLSSLVEKVYSYDENTKQLTMTLDGVTNALLIKASYAEGGSLNTITKKDIVFNNGMATVNIELGNNEKVFLWESLNTMRPLAKVYIYIMSSPNPTMTPTPTVAVTLSPTATPKVIYSENFESYSDGAAGDWTSPAGTLSIKTDSTSGINKYLTLTSGKSGTARSGYKEITAINKDFVLEANIKSSYFVSNVSAFEILESKSSLYMNHGCYSNGKYVFKMNRPRGLNQYVINNPISDSGLYLSSYEQPAIVTNEISNDPWIHVKVVGNFTDKTVVAYITSLDGKKEYYHGMTDMSDDIKSFNCLALLAPSSGNYICIDNIVIYEAREGDLSQKYHTVKIDDKKSIFSQYVLDGESVVNIPDVSTYGEFFSGWSINNRSIVYSSAKLANIPISEDSIITACIDSGYVENMSSVEFNSFPAENLLVMGSDGDTYADNNISLTILGENGTSIVTSPDSRVTDYKIDWEFIGFRTMGGNPTGDSGSVYCDSYGKVEITQKAQTFVNFQLKNTAANYYGMVKANVTYNGKTLSVSQPLLLLADAKSDEGILLPKAGYTADYNKYESGIVGYTTSENDLLTGGWATFGSDSSKIELLSDTTGQFLKVTRAGTGNSSALYNQIGSITGQTIFSQDVRFNIDGDISYVGLSGKATITEPSYTAFSFALSKSKFIFNGSELGSGTNGTWYHIVICADNTSKKCWAKVYSHSTDGIYNSSNLIGQTELLDFSGNYEDGSHYRISLTRAAGSIDFNNVNVIRSEIDESTMSVKSSIDTVNIPSGGTSTAIFEVSALTVDGNDAIGRAEWSIDDELATGVTITPNANDLNKATLTVNKDATSGILPIKVTLGGKSYIKTIKLIGTKDNVAFVTAPLGVRISDAESSYQYSAVVRDGNANDIKGRNIKYTLYDENNQNVISPVGISLDSNGKLIVTSAAKPQTISIRATSNDSSSNEISKYVKVSVYNLNFDFGSSVPAKDYTPITQTTVYNESRGYGIEGAATVENVSGTSPNNICLTGSDFTFKVKLEKGKVYNVSIVYEGKIVCERINSSLSGFQREKTALGNDTYKVAIFGDDVMDINVSGKVASISITPVSKTKGSEPDWWTIGDSTVQQNGSWAYTITNSETTELKKYPELDNVINGFHNSGRGGRQHKSYYTEGLLNGVLCGINTGDVVSISGMGTNDSTSTKDQFKEFNKIYADAIIDMGGYVILGSYTPSGNYGATKDKVYDKDNMVFRGMRTNSYEQAIRELYEERKDNPNIIGFLDIGKMSDEIMTADVKKVYNDAIASGKNEVTARNAANARADEMMGWWKDYNHYYTEFSNYILPTITKSAAKMIESIK